MHATARETNEAMRKNAIIKWLSPPDPSPNYNIAKGQRHPNTGLWCLQSSQYRDWKAKINAFLWFHGILGCGKTILSSTIIEDLQESGYIVLYFYFDFNDQSKQLFEKMIRSLISQLYQQHEKSRKHLDQLYSSCESGSKQPESQFLIATLHTMMDEVGDLKIVLDALDECSTRNELLSWLASATPKALHILLTSRKEEDIESSLTKWIPTTAVVPIQQKAVDQDIRAVVHSRLAEDGELQRWQSMPDVCEEIEKKLTEKANGM